MALAVAHVGRRLSALHELARFLHAVTKANADPVEAMHGHYCGPGCWHYAMHPDPAAWKRERGWNRWPSEIMAAYDAKHPKA